MDKKLKKDIHKYIKEINQNLICDFKTRRKFLSDITNSIYDFAESENITSVDALYQQFGTPQQIAKEFLLNADVKKIKKRMNFARLILIGIITALVIWAAALVYAAIDAKFFSDGYGVETIHEPGDYSFLEEAEENE